MPPGVEVTVREDDEGTRYLFLLNGTGVVQAVDLREGGHDLVAGVGVSGEVVLDPLQVMVVR